MIELTYEEFMKLILIMRSVDVTWVCPHCGACNLDTPAETMFPMCGGCDRSVEWSEVQDIQEYDTIREDLGSFDDVRYRWPVG